MPWTTATSRTRSSPPPPRAPAVTTGRTRATSRSRASTTTRPASLSIRRRACSLRKAAAQRRSRWSSISQPTANVTIGLSSSDTTEGTVSPASLTFTSRELELAADRHRHRRQRCRRRRQHRLHHRHGAATSSDGDLQRDRSGRRLGHQHRQQHGRHHRQPDLRPDHDRGRRHGRVRRGAQFAADRRRDDRAELERHDGGHDQRRRASPSRPPTGISPQIVTITGVNDALDDGDIGYTIVTAAATSSDGNYNGLNASDVSVTNTDNDTAGITVTPTFGLTTTEAGGTATFTVVLEFAADGGRHDRPELEQHVRGHGQPGEPDLHERQLEHPADGHRHRRQRLPGRRRHRLHDPHRAGGEQRRELQRAQCERRVGRPTPTTTRRASPSRRRPA